jgi:phosphate transport system substrate-binding protein
MKKLLSIVSVFLMLGGLILISCMRNTTKPQPYIIKVKGSDTEYEMVKDLSKSFSKSANDSVVYEVDGGGTVTGFKAFINGEIDIANASREATDKEIKMLEQNKIKYIPLMFATDAIAIITNPKLGVDSLSLEQLAKIFKGEILNWKLLGGPDLKINIHSRNYLSGTYFYFKEKFVHGEFKTDINFYESSSDIVNAVSSDIGGIGYVGSGFLMNKEGKPSNLVWAMPIHIDNNHLAYSPYQLEAIKQGDYPLTRPLYQYIKLPIKAAVKALVLFELSAIGQDLVRQHGYFPINDYQKEINKLNGYNDL